MRHGTTHNSGKAGKDAGFTLTEVLIVIVVLGLLAAVVTFSVRGLTTKARTSSCAVDKHNIETALDSYVAFRGEPPSTLDEAGLIAAGLLQDKSVLWDVLGSSVVPQPGASTTCV